MNVKQEEVFELKQEELIKDEYISDPELRLGSTFSAMPRENVTDCSYQSETTSTITNNLKFKINCQQEYFCSHCDFKTINKAFLNGHQLMHCSKLFNQCKQCDFKAFLKGDLILHTLTHKPYHCKQCDFKASLKGDLTLHMLTHSDNKPYHCKQCYFKASRKDTLQLHMLMHDVKPVHCERCDFKTPRKELLRKHMLIHSDKKTYLCNQCDYKTLQKGRFKLHMFIHSKENSNHSEVTHSPLKKICSTDRFNEDTKDSKEFLLDLEIVPEECVVFNSMDFIIKEEPNDSDL